jgi:hypothetical protein
MSVLWSIITATVFLLTIIVGFAWSLMRSERHIWEDDDQYNPFERD